MTELLTAVSRKRQVDLAKCAENVAANRMSYKQPCLRILIKDLIKREEIN